MKSALFLCGAVALLGIAIALDTVPGITTGGALGDLLGAALGSLGFSLGVLACLRMPRSGPGRLLASTLLSLLAAGASLALLERAPVDGWDWGTAKIGTWALWLGGAVFLVHSLLSAFTRRWSRSPAPGSAPVRAFLLLHLSEAAAFRPWLVGVSAAFYALYEVSVRL
jgi:hypothetical protein